MLSLYMNGMSDTDDFASWYVFLGVRSSQN